MWQDLQSVPRMVYSQGWGKGVWSEGTPLGTLQPPEQSRETNKQGKHTSGKNRALQQDKSCSVPDYLPPVLVGQAVVPWE